MKRLIIGLTIISALLTGSVYLSPKTDALSGSQFQAGRIIDDGIFFNGNGMSPTQIQAFLNAKIANGVCDTNGTQPHGGTTRAAYGTSRGYPPPYTCLKDYVQSTPTKAAETGLCNTYPGGTKTASAIIYDVSIVCNINPKVLIVLLEKEQSLVTDDWPWSLQYRSATGYGCPDTAPCDAEYYGFFNQVYNAARQYKRYAKDESLFRYRAGRDNYIQYNPNAGCGGTNVYIQNQATAGLYNYTPYQPNASALANLYGTGDGCGAYGNRNFWRLYNDWFGATLSTAYSYSFVSSSVSNVPLEIGQTKTGNFITIRNTGAATWYADGSVPPGNGAVRLSTLNYFNTVFANSSDPAWLGTKNQIKMTPATVAPGQNATFTFSLKGPAPPLVASQLLSFVPVVDGVGFMPNINMQMLISHIPPKYSFVSTSGLKPQLLPNEPTTGVIVLKNDSASTWYADGSVPVGQKATRLATKNYIETGYADRTDPAWLGTRNQIKMTPATVAPGQNATFTFKLQGPYVQHTEKLHFVPVLNGVTFLKDINMFSFTSTPAPFNSYSFVSATNPPASMTAGQIVNIGLTLKNKGNTVWRNNVSKPGSLTTRLIRSNPVYGAFNFYNSADTSWLNSAQISMDTAVVMPNENGVFNFTWKAPATPGLYQQGILPVIDGHSLMPNIGMRFDTVVGP